MKISDITKAIVATYEPKQPLMIWGAPGLGKSDSTRDAVRILQDIYYPAAATKKLGKKVQDAATFGYIDLRLATMDQCDLRGIPFNNVGVMMWSRPAFIPSEGRGLLVLEELVNASPSMQAAASQLILDRRVGEHKLGDGWHVVACGNRVSDRASVSAMPTHIANRFVHITAELNVDAWVAWALAHDIDLRVVAYIKWRSPMLHAFDPQSKALAFPTPRSWAFVSKILKTFNDLNNPLLAELIRGAVGDGPVAEFLAFCKMYAKLIDIDTIFLNPKTAPIPTDISVLWAVVTALSSRATPDNFGKIATYFNRITDEAGKPEYSVAALKEFSISDEGRADDKKLTKTRAYIEFAAKHNEYIV